MHCACGRLRRDELITSCVVSRNLGNADHASGSNEEPGQKYIHDRKHGRKHNRLDRTKFVRCDRVEQADSKQQQQTANRDSRCHANGNHKRAGVGGIRGRSGGWICRSAGVNARLGR